MCGSGISLIISRKWHKKKCVSGYGLVGPPGYGFWREVRHECVYSRHGFILAVHHILAAFVGYDLDGKRLLCTSGQFDIDSASIGPETDAMAFGGYYSTAFR